MASSIAFHHPSLALGHIVQTEVLQFIEQMDALQSRTDAAYERMNSFIALRRGLSMTINELVGLGVDVTELHARVEGLNKDIVEAANGYMTARITNDTDVQKLREQIAQVQVIGGMESPLTFNKASIKQLPLSSDSIRMDVQYFSYGTTGNTTAAIADIENAVRESTANLGVHSADVARAASAQVDLQRKNHDIAGTLVITASCTHRNTVLIDPVVIDPDKALDTWNALHAASGHALNPLDPVAMKRMAEAPATANQPVMTLLTGAHQGSSLVGMVHMVNNESTSAGLMDDQEESLQEQMRLGGWLKNAAGGFGIDETKLEEIRKALSSQSVSAHANLVVLGAVTKLSSAGLRQSVPMMMDKAPQLAAKSLGHLQGATGDSRGTFHTGTEASRNGGRLLAAQGSMTDHLIEGLAKVDQALNKVIDLNTLMNAFDNYIDAVTHTGPDGGVAGVPIGFLFREVTAAQVARLWLDKYYGQKASPPGRP